MAARTALLAPLALGGCSLFDDWFGEKKASLPGKRENIFADRRGLVVDEGAPKVVLPPAVRNAAWPQAGGNPAHLMGHLEANDQLAEAWKASIGAGGGYRQVIMAQPVVLDGVVYTMDSDAVASAFSMADGSGCGGRIPSRRIVATAPMWAPVSAPTARRCMRSTGCFRWWRWTLPRARRSGGWTWACRPVRRR